MDRIALSVIVPVYNERDSVESVINDLAAAVRDIEGGSEIIIVDDASTDGTGAILDRLGREGIKVLRHRMNRGYGAAITTGLHAASGEFVGITDADGTYPVGRFAEFLEIARHGSHDMVVGARTGDSVKVPLVRRPAKWVLGRLANYLTGRRIPDINSGMRIMKKSAIERFSRILPEGFSFTTTITLAMMTNAYSVEFVPIDYSARSGRSKIRPIRDTLNFLQLICRTSLYFRPLRVFLPLSLALVCLSILVVVVSGLFFEQIMDVTFGVTVMTAVMVLAIGLLADFIDKRMPL